MHTQQTTLGIFDHHDESCRIWPGRSGRTQIALEEIRLWAAGE
jgi:hypothetical protein